MEEGREVGRQEGMDAQWNGRMDAISSIAGEQNIFTDMKEEKKYIYI